MVNLLHVSWDKKAFLIQRPNRFLALVRLQSLNGTAAKVHVRDPGRLKELLFPGNELLLKRASRAERKTKWDLIAARCQDEYVFLNSGFHPAVARSILTNPSISPFGTLGSLAGEVKYGESRLDFLLTDTKDEKIYIEVKGCTLSRQQTALFPDAPTARGKRHLEELMGVRRQGMRAAVIFLVFRKDSLAFKANSRTDPAFAETLERAYRAGVEIYPVLLEYSHDIIWYKSILPVVFD